MKALLLSAPLKTTEDVNWTKPLNSYLLSVYGDTSEFQDDLSKITSLRQKVQNASSAVEENSVVDVFYDYYSQLELVDLRIPMSIVNKRKSLKFTWTDAFVPAEESTQNALAFEKASVLFNLASVMMKAAALKYNESFKDGSKSEASFKEGMQMTQQAAGVYLYLSENFVNGPSPDLKPSTIKFLSNLCLAQSQEMFTLKVIDGDLEQKKNSLISKLCASAAKYYEDLYNETSHLIDETWASALNSGSDDTLKDTEDDLGLDENEVSEYDPEAGNEQQHRIPAHLHPSWVAVFRAKQLYYNALAYYFQGLQLEAGSKFGEAIAYLTKSSEYLGEISPLISKTLIKSRGSNIYEMLDNLEYQKDASRIKLADLNKDNDLIYHDIVPSLVTLAEPKPMNSAKVIAMSKIEAFARISEKNYNNFLSHVVPVSIHELLSCYSEEKSQFLRNELDAVDVSNEELSSALEYLNLPKALVSIKELTQSEKPSEYGAQDSHLDPESIRKVNEISSKYAQDVANRARINQLRKEIFDCTSKSESLLNSSSSGTSHGSLREDLIKLKRSLYDATNSDSRLFALIDQDNSAFYQILGKGVNSAEFRNLFEMPDFENKSGNGQEPEISLLDMDDAQISKSSITIEAKTTRLEDLLNEINILRTKKAKLISELKKNIHEDDISDILLINSRVKSNNEIKSIIFPEELKKFNGYSGNLDSLITKQKTYMGEIRSLWEEITTDPKVKKIQSSSAFRNGLLSEQKAKIEAFYDNNWIKYTVGVHKGAEFYNSLLDYARGLQNTIERESQAGSFTQSMASLNLGNNYTGNASGAYSSQDAHQGASFSGNAAHTAPNWDASNHKNVQQSQGINISRQNSSNFVPQQFPTPSAAPQLPPKRPSQSSFSQSFSPSFSQPPGAFQTTAPAYRSDQGTQPHRATQEKSSSNDQTRRESGLIYDQPSAYQPNMYDLFSLKKN